MNGRTAVDLNEYYFREESRQHLLKVWFFSGKCDRKLWGKLELRKELVGATLEPETSTKATQPPPDE